MSDACPLLLLVLHSTAANQLAARLIETVPSGMGSPLSPDLATSWFEISRPMMFDCKVEQLP